jgi:hypothetical protein
LRTLIYSSLIYRCIAQFHARVPSSHSTPDFPESSRADLCLGTECADDSIPLKALNYTSLHNTTQHCGRDLDLGCSTPRHFDRAMMRLRLPATRPTSTQCSDEAISVSHQITSAGLHCTVLHCVVVQMHRDFRSNALLKSKHRNCSQCVQVGPGRSTPRVQACFSLLQALH